MTVQQITDSESMARQRLLLTAMEFNAKHYAAVAQADRLHGNTAEAYDNEQTAAYSAWVASLVRKRMTAASALSVDDAEQLATINALTAQINDEPPRTLVPLVGWVKGMLGRWFPWVLPTDWQAIGMLLLRGRP